MNLGEIKALLASLTESERKKVIAEYMLSIQPLTGVAHQCASDTTQALNPLTFGILPQLLADELKRQNITYEEMAIQIGVSLSTFKRLIAKPSSAKAINLHALLKELGIKVWLEK